MSDAVHYLTLIPRDPIIARDGRPFGAGLRMKSLDWPYPTVVAGSLRTMLGHLHGGFQNGNLKILQNQLKSTSVHGPFPQVDGQLYFPAPLDIVVRKQNDELDAFGIRPWDLNDLAGGCDLPDGLSPVMFPAGIEEDFKPETVPYFWSCQMITRWLSNPKGEHFLAHGVDSWPNEVLYAPQQDERMHVQMDYGSGAGVESMLFKTVGLDLYRFPRATHGQRVRPSSDRLALRITGSADFTSPLQGLSQLSPMGGERRLITWQHDVQPSGWECPQRIHDALQAADKSGRKFVRMILATPAIFSGGWKPGWLNQEPHGLVGTIPGTQVEVRLIAACVDRWRPISGWSYETHGEKPVQRLVPACSVYFFHVQEGQCADLASRWPPCAMIPNIGKMASVCRFGAYGSH